MQVFFQENFCQMFSVFAILENNYFLYNKKPHECKQFIIFYYINVNFALFDLISIISLRGNAGYQYKNITCCLLKIIIPNYYSMKCLKVVWN